MRWKAPIADLLTQTVKEMDGARWFVDLSGLQKRTNFPGVSEARVDPGPGIDIVGRGIPDRKAVCARIVKRKAFLNLFFDIGVMDRY